MICRKQEEKVKEKEEKEKKRENVDTSPFPEETIICLHCSLPVVVTLEKQMCVRLSCKTVPKETANHSSTLAWRIPWREEAGRLQSMASQRVGHD